MWRRVFINILGSFLFFSLYGFGYYIKTNCDFILFNYFGGIQQSRSWLSRPNWRPPPLRLLHLPTIWWPLVPQYLISRQVGSMQRPGWKRSSVKHREPGSVVVSLVVAEMSSPIKVLKSLGVQNSLRPCLKCRMMYLTLPMAELNFDSCNQKRKFFLFQLLRQFKRHTSLVSSSTWLPLDPLVGFAIWACRPAPLTGFSTCFSSVFSGSDVFTALLKKSKSNRPKNFSCLSKNDSLRLAFCSSSVLSLVAVKVATFSWTRSSSISSSTGLEKLGNVNLGGAAKQDETKNRSNLPENMISDSFASPSIFNFKSTTYYLQDTLVSTETWQWQLRLRFEMLTLFQISRVSPNSVLTSDW